MKKEFTLRLDDAACAELENLKKLSKESGFTLPSGAGNLSDKIAAQIIKSQGVDALNQLAKLHFANTQKAIKIAQL